MSDDREMSLCEDPNCGDNWIECTVCGCEFCATCHPHSRLCPDCTDQAALEIICEAPLPDFDDVPDLDAIIHEIDTGKEPL